MSYSLLSRFKSTLLGSTMGAALYTPRNSSIVGQDNQQPDWSYLFHYQPSELINMLQQVLGIVSESGHVQELSWQQRAWNSGEAAYITLPILLFHHESWSLLQPKITQIAQYCQWSTEVLEDVLIWGYIVALILKGRLGAKSIIEQLIVGVGAKQNPSWQLLKQLELWLFESLSLEQVVEKLSNQTQEWSIPLSLYCFSSTPENFYLSIRRAAHYQAKSPIAAMLTGALAGAYNGMEGIPTAWLKISYQNSIYQQIEQQGEILFSAWSGVYQGEYQASINREAIAAAGTIQPRSSLTVISQQE